MSKSDYMGKNALMNAWIAALEEGERELAEGFIRGCRQAFRQFGAQSAKELLFEILKTEILRRRQYGNPRYITKSIG